MTTVGVQFMAQKEIERHNRVTEGLGEKELRVKEGTLDVQRGSLGESIRHNLVSEAQQEYANTTGRLNAIANSQNADTNRARLGLDTYIYQDTGRLLTEAQAGSQVAAANKANAEAEKARSQIGLISAQVAQTAADTGMKKSQTAKNQQDTELARQRSSGQKISNVQGVFSTITSGVNTVSTIIDKVTGRENLKEWASALGGLKGISSLIG